MTGEFKLNAVFLFSLTTQPVQIIQCQGVEEVLLVSQPPCVTIADGRQRKTIAVFVESGVAQAEFLRCSAVTVAGAPTRITAANATNGVALPRSPLSCATTAVGPPIKRSAANSNDPLHPHY